MSEQLRRELETIAHGGGPHAEAARTALGSDTLERRLDAAIRALAGHRGARSSTCPSDAARAVGGPQWRTAMDAAREISRQLARRGLVQITQRGEVLDPDAPWRGPIRIRAADLP
ncbi:DUF3253 domain-containing protein [Mycolicibacterium sp. 018/SC-01/001]|uniref:DUF3253 domain-containing protein n=1 Tax=Mycolicibacterium sp. 018/SC-01/001 TaxID=2592069 RepID=UPI00117CABB8|nr:DUF3253 domain-containing protein [Mycolicibacterium sp. 018/SC-01/001]TRW77024.1 DUF3253 domain-containing protein [Mycolicibacterium sp. 018/SC-01/001]